MASLVNGFVHESYSIPDLPKSNTVHIFFPYSTMNASEKMVESSLFARNPSKRWGELYFLAYAVIWISEMALIVASGIYEEFKGETYMLVGLIICVPCIVFPIFFPGEADKSLPFHNRYWVKASVWIAVISFVGNYLWTHYFYSQLGATYTGALKSSWNLNDVPFCLYLITFAYFSFYHTLTTITLRWFWNSAIYNNSSRIGQYILSAAFVGSLAYITAFMEAFTIASFPYYEIKDRTKMYLFGSALYGIYFIVSFPMFYRIDEFSGDRWTLSRCFIDSCGGCMMVTMLLEFWRIGIGPIVDQESLASPLPFMA